MLPTSAPTGSQAYWQGADNNYYMTSPNGVQNMGGSLAPLSAQTIAGMTQIQDPNAPQSGAGSTGGSLAGYQSSFLNGLPTALQNVSASGADAFGNAQNNLQSNAQNIFSGLRTGQQNIDVGRQNNELGRMNASQDLLGYIRGGLHQGASQISNMNAMDSSAPDALQRAYNVVGNQKQRSINNQAAVAGSQFDIQQNNLGQNTQDQLSQFHLMRDNLVNQIGSTVRNQLAQLNQQAVGLSLPDQVNVEQQKQQIIDAGMGQLQGVDNWLQGQVGTINPMASDQIQAQAHQLQQAGNAQPSPFNAGGPIQQTMIQGPQISQLPLFSARKQN